jgi:hypothetical protein
VRSLGPISYRFLGKRVMRSNKAAIGLYLAAL